MRRREYDAGASLIYQASQRVETKENSWTSQQTFLILNLALVLLRRRLLKAFKESAFVILCIDRKAFKDFNAGR
jgi:hypothetical protein